MKENEYANHYIPIYNVKLTVGAGPDLGKLRNSRFVLRSWKPYDCEDISALCSSKGPYFMVLFQYGDDLTHGRIGHEVMHVVNCIMTRAMHKIDSETDEPCSYLCEYITNLVYKDLKRWKVSVR